MTEAAQNAWYTPAEDGDLPVVGASWPSGHGITAPTAAVYDRTTGTAVTTSSTATVAGADGNTWYYDLANVTGINLSTVTNAQLRVEFTPDGGATDTSLRYADANINGSQKEQALAAYQGAVWLHNLLGTAGTTYPIGTPGTPANTMANALTISANTNLITIKIGSGTHALAAPALGLRFDVIGSAGGVFIFMNAGSSLAGCVVVAATVFYNAGSTFGANNTFDKCILVNPILGSVNTFKDCLVTGTITLNGLTVFERCTTYSSTPVTLDATSLGATVCQMSGWFGDIIIANVTAGTVKIDSFGSNITINATCTGGVIIIAGIIGTLIDNSAGSVVSVSRVAVPGDEMDLVTDAVDTTSLADGAITAAKVATDAIDADALATDAVNEIRDAILSDSTPFAGANIDAAISSRAAPGDAMDLVANAVDATSVATDAIDADALATDAVNEIRDAILSDSTPFAGANIDAAISSRAAPGDAMTLTGAAESSIVDAVWDEDIVAAHGTADTSGLLVRSVGAGISQRTNNSNLNDLLGVADSASNDLPAQIDTELSAAHGSGAWDGTDSDWTTTEREQIRFRLAMDGTQTDPTTNTGTIEDILSDTSTMEPLVSTNLDATVSSRAAPGDAMDLVANAVDATSVATDAIDADALATDAVNEIRDSILSDSTAFAGANIDAAISTRAAPGDAMTLTAGAELSVVDAVWDENIVSGHGTADTAGLILRALGAIISQRTNNANLNDLLGVADSAGNDLPAQVDTELSASHGAGAWDASSSDWTVAERNEIRGALGITGTQSAPGGGGELQDVRDALVSAELTVAAGSTAQTINTGATQADNYYNDMLIIVQDSSGIAARRIAAYSQTSGAFTVDVPLPFTPAVSSRVLILNETAKNVLTVPKFLGLK